MSPRLILASTSRYRAQLLGRLGLPFQVEAPGADESPRSGELPGERAARLALAKATAVSSRHPEDWVIGSDQVAACGGRFLDKPGTEARSREQLAACSGRGVEFHTAVVLLRARPPRSLRHLDLTTVHFRSLSEAEIERYVALDRPLDCAGAIRSEGIGVSMMSALETRDPTALIGLPLIWLSSALREAGFDPLAAAQA